MGDEELELPLVPSLENPMESIFANFSENLFADFNLKSPDELDDAGKHLEFHTKIDRSESAFTS